MRLFTGIVVLTQIIGCGAGQMATKSQIASQCQSSGLKGCDELADGSLEYIEGNRASAETKLRTAAAKNQPERLQRFRKSLEPLIASLDADTSKSLREVLTFLSTPTNKDSTSGVALADSPNPELPNALVPYTPRTVQPTQQTEDILSGTANAATDEPGTDCIAGSLKRCRRSRVTFGPFTITNLYSSGGCPDELLLFGGSATRPRWTLLNLANDKLNISGRFRIEDGEALYIVARTANPSLKLDERCAVTWSGFGRPADPKN